MRKLSWILVFIMTISIIFSCFSSPVLADIDGIAYYKFDEGTGTKASDELGNLSDATLNGATWANDREGKVVKLSGASQYIGLPNNIMSGVNDVTVSMWVKLDTVQNWMKIFDFGRGTSNYMYLTPKADNGKIRFAIKNGGSEKVINGYEALSTGGWKHIAVTISGNTGILYVDGMEVGKNTGMTINPTDLGFLDKNYIGKSQRSDPYLDGAVDDLRIYDRALSHAEIHSLYQPPITTGIKLTYEPGDFLEAAVNDGTIATSKDVLLDNTTFKNETFVEGTHFTTNCSTKIPGLTMNVTYMSENRAVIRLGGMAETQTARTVDGLSITFKAAAFTTGVLPDGYNKADMKVNFIDGKPIKVLEIYPSETTAYHGDYKDVSNALSGLSGYEVTSMSLNKFISLIDDVNGNYDIVYFGRGTYFKNAVDLNVFGNDITNKAANKVIEFIKAKQLCIFHPDAFKTHSLDSYSNTVMITKFMNNAEINTKTYFRKLDVASNNSNLSAKLREAVLSYSSSTINKRPILSVSEKPASYTSIDRPLDSRIISYNFKVKDMDTTGSAVTANLFIDKNNDRLFESNECIETKVVNSGSDSSIIFTMPGDMTGIFFWKLEIIDKDHAKDEIVDVFRLKGNEIEMNVLQILPFKNVSDQPSDYTGDLQYLFENTYDEYGNAIGYRPGEYRIKVTKVGIGQFNKPGNPDTYHLKSLNGNYDMIVLGFRDCYSSGIADLDNDAVDRIKDFIRTSQGVMFTHDTIYDNGNPNITNNFRIAVGQASGKTAANLNKTSSNSTLKTNYSLADYADVDANFDGNNPTTLVQNVRRVNSNAITLYPYDLGKINDGIIKVAPTHTQYYKLDLENEAVIPLFNMYKESTSERVQDDAMNDYYTYSIGNITYSGTGHAYFGEGNSQNRPYDIQELKLFSNTMLKAYASANHKPEIVPINPLDGAQVSAGDNNVMLSFRAYDFDIEDEDLYYEVWFDVNNDGDFERQIGTKQHMVNGATVASIPVPKNFNNARYFKIRVVVKDDIDDSLAAFSNMDLTLSNVDIPIVKPNLELNKSHVLAGDSVTATLGFTTTGSGFYIVNPSYQVSIPTGSALAAYTGATPLSGSMSPVDFGQTIGTIPAKSFTIQTKGLTDQGDYVAVDIGASVTETITPYNGAPNPSAIPAVQGDNATIYVRSGGVQIAVLDERGNSLKGYTVNGMTGADLKASTGGTRQYFNVPGGERTIPVSLPGYSIDNTVTGGGISIQVNRGTDGSPNWVNAGTVVSNAAKLNVTYDDYKWRITYHVKLDAMMIPVSYYKVIKPYNGVDFLGEDNGALPIGTIFTVKTKKDAPLLLAALFKIDPIGTNVKGINLTLETLDDNGYPAIITSSPISFYVSPNPVTDDTKPLRDAGMLNSLTNNTPSGGTYGDPIQAKNYYVLIQIPKAYSQKIRVSSIQLVIETESGVDQRTFETSALISISDLDVPPLR